MTAGVGWLSCCAERHLEAGSRGSRAGGDKTQGGSFGRRSKMNGRGLLIPAPGHGLFHLTSVTADYQRNTWS